MRITIIEDGDFAVWASLDGVDGDPRHMGESFVLGMGPTREQAIEDSRSELAAALVELSRKPAREAGAAIKAPGTPQPDGTCQIRPALDGSEGNPMQRCWFIDGHEGPHSWQK